MNSLIPWKRGEIRKTAQHGTPVTQLRSDWDRLFDRFLDDFWGPSVGGAPSDLMLDVSETDEEIVVRADVPGIAPKDLDIQVAGDVLTITGKRLEESEGKGARYHHSERRFGSFQRSIGLPIPVEADKVDAVHENGVLTVTLRKAESLRPRKIEVRTS